MESNMHQSEDNKFIPMTSVSSGKVREARSDVFYYTNQIVNVVFIGTPDHWVLVDAGMPKCGEEIRMVAEDIFGANSKPSAIILTHGHFDHVGGIVHLIEHWNVPVYAHPNEFPFLTGEQSYPEPDTTVEGGMLAKISSIYPNEPINIKPALQPLPGDMSVPGLPEWKWVYTPGHSPGQVALFRESDRTLISADAFITVKQDSLYKVLVQKKEVCGPPVYLTTDWPEAFNSVKTLEALRPEIVIPGHGTAMEGAELTEGLRRLVNEFDEIAVPDHGKFVGKEK
ncbi:MAG: MBL fold metallo-hydrolase [Segetibacter sp.]|nr:MBL fold metallo-hydrolase [Segetibacter sp.]